jgi:Spy/CpxP family protein refolding chaperone
MLKRYGIPTVYLLIVFVCGLAVGVFGYRFYQLKSVSASAPATRSPDEWKKRHVEELKDRLRLTPDQVSKLSGILDQTRAESRDAMETLRPRMEAIQNEQYANVKAILTPEQQAEYAKFHAERERQRREHPRF